MIIENSNNNNCNNSDSYNNGCNNNCNNDKNEDINYILFKKIFNNKLLLNYIFSKVHEINYNISYNKILKCRNLNSESMGLIKAKCIPYNEIPYNVIFKKDLVEIFKDRIKMKIKFKQNESIEYIHKLFINFVFRCNISNEEFKEFYKSNIFYLNRNLGINLHNGENQDIFHFLVLKKDYEKLLIVYEIEKDAIESEMSYYYQFKENNKIENNKFYENYGFNKVLVIDVRDYNNYVKSPFRIFFNNVLIKQTLSSTLDIVKFFHQVLFIDYSHFDNLLVWLLESKNEFLKNQIFNYFLDQSIPFIPVIINSRKDISFFDILFYLEYSTFCRIIEIEKGLKIYQNQFLLHKQRGVNYNESGEIEPNSRSKLNYFLITLHLEYIQSNSSKKLTILNLIKKFYTDGVDNTGYSLSSNNYNSYINPINWLLIDFLYKFR